MPARLIVHAVDRPAGTFDAREGHEYWIGRDPQCDLVLEDDRISRRHARLRGGAEGWVLFDEGSKNGTLVDGVGIGSASLRHGSWVSFGGLPVRFELRTEEEARRDAEGRLRRWQTSLDLQRELVASPTLRELLRRLLDSLLQLAQAERGFVMLAAADGELEVLALAGVSPEELREPRFGGSLTAVERALAARRTFATSDALADTLLAERPSVVLGGIRALVSIPLVALGRLLGVAYLDSSRSGAVFDALDVEILEALAQHAALAIAVARADLELRRLAASLAQRPGIEREAGLRLRHDLEAAWGFSPAPVEAAAPGFAGARVTLSALLEHHRGGAPPPG